MTPFLCVVRKVLVLVAPILVSANWQALIVSCRPQVRPLRPTRLTAAAEGILPRTIFTSWIHPPPPTQMHPAASLSPLLVLRSRVPCAAGPSPGCGTSRGTWTSTSPWSPSPAPTAPTRPTSRPTFRCTSKTSTATSQRTNTAPTCPPERLVFRQL